MIMKELAEICEELDKAFGFRNKKEGLKLAVQIQQNRLLRDLADYFKKKK